MSLEESNQGFQEAVRTYDMIDTMRKYSEKIMLYEDLEFLDCYMI